MKVCQVKSAAETSLFSIVVTTVMVLPSVVWAHHFMENQLPQTFAQGFLSGLAHPVIGVDHLAFIIATGFLLALVKHGVWGVIAFTLGSLLGAALHLTGFDLTGGEVMVALSVIVIGGAMMSGHRVTLAWLAGGLILAGIFHGYAYAESIFGAEPMPLSGYLIGFCSVQLGIGVAALLVHRRLIAVNANSSRSIASAMGAVVGVIGVAFLASNAIA
jgi:urease accessory protein